MLPPERKPQGGRPGKSNREMLNAMVYWLNTGIPWRDLPERFGPWQSAYSRFRAWTKAGVWEDVLTNLIQQDIVDETTLMLDSTTVKVHQHASGAKKGRQRGHGPQPWRTEYKDSYSVQSKGDTSRLSRSVSNHFYCDEAIPLLQQFGKNQEQQHFGRQGIWGEENSVVPYRARRTVDDPAD